MVTTLTGIISSKNHPFITLHLRILFALIICARFHLYCIDFSPYLYYMFLNVISSYFYKDFRYIVINLTFLKHF